MEEKGPITRREGRRIGSSSRILDVLSHVAENIIITKLVMKKNSNLHVRKGPIRLKLFVAPTQKILRARALQPHHVQQHAVRQVHGRIQRICPSVHHIFYDARLHLLVHHQDDEAAVVEATSACAPAHLQADTSARANEISTRQRARTRFRHVKTRARDLVNEVVVCASAIAACLLNRWPSPLEQKCTRR
jgi:hypothetical protein